MFLFWHHRTENHYNIFKALCKFCICDHSPPLHSFLTLIFLLMLPQKSQCKERLFINLISLLYSKPTLAWSLFLFSFCPFHPLFPSSRQPKGSWISVHELRLQIIFIVDKSPKSIVWFLKHQKTVRKNAHHNCQCLRWCL